MKVEAYVEIVNDRLQPTISSRNSNKPAYCQLSCVKDTSNKHVLLISHSNKTTVSKYYVLNNVEKIFCKFINDGKATIKLKEPSISILIQKASVNQLKLFLKSIQLASINRLNDDNVDLNKENTKASSATAALSSAMASVQPVKKPQTSINIQEPAEYIKLLKCYKDKSYNYKESLQKLQINNCNMYANKLNKNLFNNYFKQLAILNLNSNNLLGELNDLYLPCLKELYLAHNGLTTFNYESCNLTNVYYLDLSFNKFELVPNKFCILFKNLKYLRLNNNEIKYLNNNFGNYYTINLKQLYLSSNQLMYLPYSVFNLRLDILELDNNLFQYKQHYSDYNQYNRTNAFPRLTELASRCIVNCKVRYHPSDMPATLYNYLSNKLACICGKSCFTYNFKLIALLNMSRMSQSYSCMRLPDNSNENTSSTITTSHSLIPILVYLCSLKCYISNSQQKPLIIW